MRASCQPASGAPLSRPEQGRGLMRLRVGLLGGGSWGTTVASVVSRNAPITLWARDAATVDGINRLHENHKYLPGIKLPPALRATADMAEAVAGADVLVVGVPSHSFRAVLEEAKRHLRPWVPVISLTKGLELEIGRASWRESVCHNVSIPGVAG